MRPAPRPADYHRLGIAAKRAAANQRQAEPAVRCPACETALPPRDLLAHLAQRCPGRRRPDPHRAAHWLTVGDVVAMGVSGEALELWRERGLVRVRGEGAGLQVLQRDLVLAAAWARALGGP